MGAKEATIALDPSEVSVGRTALLLNHASTGLYIDDPGPDWGDAAVAPYLADLDVGSVTVSSRLPNRTIRIPLSVVKTTSVNFDTAMLALRAKVGLIQRTGRGWFKRQAGLYADVVGATLTIPDQYGQTQDAEPSVVLSLECLPDFYGDEITLTVAGGTGFIAAPLQFSGSDYDVLGDYPGRCRIQVTEAAAQNQKGLIGGFRCRNYSTATTGKLAYESGLMTPINGAAAAALTGASGASAVTLALPVAGTWIPILVTNLTSGNAPLTHKGSYRVWARVYSATGTPRIRFKWGVGSLSVPVVNEPVQIPGPAGFYLVDLGEIRLDPAPYGTHQWFGAFEGQAGVAGDPLSIDEVFFQPLDEAAFSFTAVDQPSPSVVKSADTICTNGADNSGTGTVAWTSPQNAAIVVNNTLDDWAHITITGDAVISHYLVATNFGFALPSSATVVGVEFWFKYYATVPANWVDNAVRIVKGGAVQATEEKTTMTQPRGAEWRTYGGPTNMWGATLAYSDVNASTFGLALSLKHLTANMNTAWVQSVGCNVYYTLGTGFSVAPDAVLYASKLAEIRTEGAWRNDAGSIPGPMSGARGQNPRIPPSGLEGGSVELFLKNSRGDLDQQPDAGLDAMTAQVIYRPSYLHRK